MYVINSTGDLVIIVSLGAGVVILFLLFKYCTYKISDVEKTRSRIARDLHDEIGSSLSSVALMIDMVSSKTSITEKDKAELLSISRIIHDIIDSLRNVIWVINPERDRLDTLVERMKSIACTMLQNIHCEIDVHMENPDKVISMDSKRTILLLYKEALNNIVKHAGATKVVIGINEGAGCFRLFIEDNGVGFNQAQLSQGDGLQNMHYRARQIHGTLSIESAQGSGTKLELKMNLVQNKSITIYEGGNETTQIGCDQHLAG